MFEYKDASNGHKLVEPRLPQSWQTVAIRLYLIAQEAQCRCYLYDNTETKCMRCIALDAYNTAVIHGVVDKVAQLQEEINVLRAQLRRTRALYQRDFECDL